MSYPILNFELIWFFQVDEAIRRIKEEFLTKQSSSSIIAGSMLEIFKPDQSLEYIIFLKKIRKEFTQLGVNKIYLILHRSFLQYEEIFKDFDIIYFDHHAMMTDLAYVNEHNSTAESWNFNSRKFLFLTGVPHRRSRIGLLFKFFKEDLLKNSIWTFFEPFNEYSKIEARKILQDISDEEYINFIDAHKRTIEDPKIYCNNGPVSAIYPNDWRIDKKYYEDTCISVISESYFYNQEPKYYVTEKTWRTIINKHPFIFAGQVNFRKYLESLGFKTFTEYLEEDYDSIEDPDKRLDSVVKNLKYFLKNVQKNQEQINSDVEFNFVKFKNLVKSNIDTISYIKSLGFDESDINKYLKCVQAYDWVLKDKTFLTQVESSVGRYGQ